MRQEQVKSFWLWFDEYVAGFYGEDEFVNSNLKLKEQHSRRTCQEMRYLAGELGLSDNQKRIAEVIALFHDIGRFEQFVRYRTYNDPRSIDHSLLGVEILRKTKALERVDENERKWIEKAIEYHGCRELPEDLNGQYLLFSQLIRDADKLDVFYVVTDYYRRYRENPKDFKLEVELPDEPGYSKNVIEKTLRGQQIDYSELRTLNDMKLCQLGWVYDVNFTATLRRIRQQRFLEQLFGFLPDSPDIEKVKEKIISYVNLRIEQEQRKK